MALPRGTTGSLAPAFAPARPVGLAVRRACALALAEAGFRPARAHRRAPPLRFGRRPPQSNCPPRGVPAPAHGARLDSQRREGGISRTPPRGLAPPPRRLPPILHNPRRLPA